MNFQKINEFRILHKKSITNRVHQWRLFKKKIVFTNGCFDILHKGHLDYLSEARNLGDILIIGLNSDASVRKLKKGSNRPIHGQDARAAMLASLIFVDAVIPFEEETPLALIELIKPDVLVKGADYETNQIVGAEYVNSYGGVVHRIPLTEGFSTTAILDKLSK